MACSKACAKNDDIAKRTGEEVKNALDGTDTSDLKAYFRHALSFSIPPLTLYRNYRPGGYSNLIFGVPLVDLRMNEEKIPKVMRMCIEEVEKRGLHIENIYTVSLLLNDFFRFMLKSPSRIIYVTQEYGRQVEMCCADLLADSNADSVRP